MSNQPESARLEPVGWSSLTPEVISMAFEPVQLRTLTLIRWLAIAGQIGTLLMVHSRSGVPASTRTRTRGCRSVGSSEPGCNSRVAVIGASR